MPHPKGCACPLDTDGLSKAELGSRWRRRVEGPCCELTPGEALGEVPTVILKSRQGDLHLLDEDTAPEGFPARLEASHCLCFPSRPVCAHSPCFCTRAF